MAALANVVQNTLPKHLEPFCQPTAGSVMKLLAVWDGLSIESLLLLLEEIKDREIPDDLKDRIFKKAFESDNPYLRYLGYMYTNKWNDIKELEDRALNDHNPLVRSSVYEARPNFLNKETTNPGLYYSLPQEVRLAVIRREVAWTDVNGETGEDAAFIRVSFERNIAEIIKYGMEQALPQQQISKLEFGDLIREIFLTPTKTAFLSNGDIKFSSLWKTISSVPDFAVSFFLKTLPAKGAEELTEDEIKPLLPWQIKTLFWRSDIELNDLRKKYLLTWQEGDEDLEEIAELAATNLALTDDEFTNLLSMPDITKEKILRNLANRGEALYLHHHAAACEIVGTSFVAGEIFNKRLAKLKAQPLYKRHEEYLQYRIYMQARQICSRYAADTEAEQLPFELRKHLSKQVVRRDAWSTYMAFKNADIWRKSPELINFLPGDEISWILKPKERLNNYE